MTDKELEKKAEEWVIDCVCKDCSRYEKCKSKEHCTCEECSKEKWQKGAEFGYNKSNEWHFIKDGDLPKENQLVLLYRENPNGVNVALTHWYKSYVNDKVIAWKEVIPPKELDE